MTTFILIHSPLVGSMTWSLVADELRKHGHQAVLPTLTNDPAFTPYWKQHGQNVAQMLGNETLQTKPILVAHSGAGPLLPAVRQALGVPVVGYLFVDAGLPHGNKSRLDMFGDPEEVARFRASAVDGFRPPWTADDLREIIPDDAIRERYAAEFRPMPLAVYEEPLPVFTGWPDAPCGYLQFSAPYDASAAEARSHGWAYSLLPSGHFHMLVAPEAVTLAMLDLTHKMRIT